MGREVQDWDDAAADAYSFLNERRRGYTVKQMLAVVDELCIRESAPRSEITARFDADLVATTLGHVTTAVHGPGSVPSRGGWYMGLPDAYSINPAFAEAWRRKRRLDRHGAG